MHPLARLHLVLVVLLGAACGGKVVFEPAGGAGGGQGTGGAASSSGGAGGAAVCPAGTCKLDATGICEAPSGPQGNACCQCGADGFCSQFCKCASPDPPIATPGGERSIASLRPGDLVYSVQGAQVVVVPILTTHQSWVGPDHRVVRVRFAGGATVEISGGHPTLDGRVFADLRRGGRLGGAEIVEIDSVPYAHDRTYDILPDSDSGGYFAGGVLVGSTLKPAARVDL